MTSSTRSVREIAVRRDIPNHHGEKQRPRPGGVNVDETPNEMAWLIPRVHGQAALTSASAVTFPPDAAMIASMVSRVMFC